MAGASFSLIDFFLISTQVNGGEASYDETAVPTLRLGLTAPHFSHQVLGTRRAGVLGLADEGGGKNQATPLLPSGNQRGVGVGLSFPGRA